MQKIVYIGVDQLHPHPNNPRKNLGDLTELAESIKAKGVLQNLTVVPAEEGYHVVIGNRRHAAAKLAELAEVPCVISDMSPQEQFETMMVENMQRSDLTVYEQAEGFQMMLDMGVSVEQASQKTGFSESTIRNRVKLLQLDKKKFQKAEKRGATLQDYLKLNAIKDPSQRNKVLDTIGTPEFNNALKKALDHQEAQAYMQRIRADFEKADWCTKLPNNTPNLYSDYPHVASYSSYNKIELVKPADADTVEYFYTDTNDSINLRKKKTAAQTPADPKEERRQKLKSKLETIKNKLTKISMTHLELRDDFIHDFKAFSTYEMDIEAFAVKALILAGSTNVNRLDHDRLGNLLGVGRKNDRLDMEELNSKLFKCPQYALLCTAYTLLEGSGQKYNGSGCYDVSYYGFPPKHEKNPKLDLIYEALCSLGYEMSEEEIQMQKGEHPLYQKAKDLIAAFKKEEGQND